MKHVFSIVNRVRIISIVLIMLFLSSILPGCITSESDLDDFDQMVNWQYLSYRDIPGVTEKEIEAIEAFREQGASFTYGMIFNTEAFINADGEIDGFAALVCEWLTGFFEIPFTPAHFLLEDLFSGLESDEIDFTGYLTLSPARREVYIMTEAIAFRNVVYFRLNDSEPLSSIKEARLPRYALVEGLVTTENVLKYAAHDFEPVFISHHIEAYELMKNGEVDAFVSLNNNTAIFEEFDDVIELDFLPLISSAASIATQNEDLRPFISVLDKALDDGALQYLNDLYNQGEKRYLIHRFNLRLTNEEKEFIRLSPVIRFAAEINNYPFSAYKERFGEWQGISHDVLRAVEILTGLEFRIINESNTSSYDLLIMLEAGQAQIFSELLKTPDREGRFIWPDTPFMTSNFALISGAEREPIELSEIYSITVGAIRGSAYAEQFKRWFPDHRHLVETDGDVFDLLLNGEVDMVMFTDTSLLWLTHYREESGYKVNYVFDEGIDSTFGINKDEVILASIIEKSLQSINLERISQDWTTRVYDYSRVIAEERTTSLIIWIIVIFSVLIILTALLSYIANIKNRHQRQTAQQLRLAKYDRTKYMLASEALHMALWDMDIVAGEMINVDSNINYSLEFINMLGYYDFTEFPNKLSSWRNRLHPDDRREVVRAFEAHILDPTGETPYNMEFRLKTATGEYRYFHAFGTTLRDDMGNPLRVAGALRDIHDDKLKDEALETATREANAANKAKSEFLSSMSHEIRTPMNSIMGFAELAMLEEDLPPGTKENLSKIADNTIWLLNIINDILDISKIEAGKIELEYRPFKLADIITRCKTVIMPKILEKGLELRVYAEALTGKRLMGDSLRIYQALLNLISNAVKFTDSGEVKIAAAVIKQTDNSATVLFEVADNGIGMTPEQVSRIFEPFVQADSSTTRNYGGTGLGLAITKGFVEMMGGELLLESSPGAGSIFSFKLTFDTVDVPEEEILQTSAEKLEKPFFTGLVLVCDDNSMNQQVMHGHLKNVGLDTEFADNGKIAIERVRERKEKGDKPFDLIMMDIYMPVMGGEEAATAINGLNTGSPIVAVTANVMAGEVEKYKECGMPDCLGKPFTSQELWALLLKYFTPDKLEEIDLRQQTNDGDNKNVLYVEFMENNKNRYMEIIDAISADDFELAHRLAHSLKGNAGFLGKTILQEAAGNAEQLLADGKNVPEELLQTISQELSKVLDEISPIVKDIKAREQATKEDVVMLSDEQTLELLNKLEVLLRDRDTDCMDYVSDVYAVSGGENLAKLIEKCKFKQALEELKELRNSLSTNDN